MKEKTKRLYKLVARATYLMNAAEDLRDDIGDELEHSDYVLPMKSQDTLDQIHMHNAISALEQLRLMMVRLTEAMVYAEEEEPDNDNTKEEPGDEAFPGKYWTGDDAESHTEPV